jgi:histidinol-phosphate aminotransferase
MDLNKTQNNIKLSQNENPFGPSPKAIEAVLKNFDKVSLYPEPHSISLKNKLAEKLHLSSENIFVSSGLVESIDILIRNLIAKDENLIIPELTFVAYKILADVFKKEVRLSKMKNFHVDVDDILSRYDEKTKAIIIANPNNPTGTVISENELLKILDNVQQSTYVVIDEAYIEYANHPDYPDTLKLQKKYSNLVVMRTFSKIYGLAGLRVGYTIANKELIEKLDFLQAPFTVNRMASIAALNAIDDDYYIKMCATANLSSREKLFNEIISIGWNVVPSEGNFLFVYFENEKERDFFFDLLEEKKVLARKTDLFGENSAFRITIGTPEMNEIVIQHLREIKVANY